jgi:DNA polymerase III sliding clamp (beta) subunit (PCNA family)
MKNTITFNKKDLKRVLQNTLTSSKDAVGILSSVKFEAKDNQLTVTSITGYSGLLVTIPCVCKNHIIFSTRQDLLSLILLSPQEQIDLIVKEQFVTVKNTKIKLAKTDVTLFSEVPNHQSTGFALTKEHIDGILEASTFVAEKKAQKPILTGVRLTLTKDCLKVQATDSYRVFSQEFTDVETTLVDTQKLVLTLASDDLKVLSLFDSDLPINLSVRKDGENVDLVFFEQDTVLFYTATLLADYPNLDALLEMASGEQAIDIRPKDLKTALDAVAQISCQEGAKAYIIFKQDGENILAGLDHYVASFWLPVTAGKMNGEEIVFNPQFLKVLTRDNWTWVKSDASSFNKFVCDNKVYVIMPVQIRR